MSVTEFSIICDTAVAAGLSSDSSHLFYLASLLPFLINTFEKQKSISTILNVSLLH